MGLPGGEGMKEVSKGQMDAREIWASDRRKAAMATKLLACHVGVAIEPGFDLAEPGDKELASRKPLALGECLFKDARCEVVAGEYWYLRLLVVDEKGNVLARYKRSHPLGHALDMMGRLPLPPSPRAEDWLKKAMGEGRPVSGQGQKA